jgi:hypothetical protein
MYRKLGMWKNQVEASRSLDVRRKYCMTPFEANTQEQESNTKMKTFLMTIKPRALEY